ncbi:MAG: hypothetical protein U0521_09350 [Anaerolineae bacterium]
MSPSIDQLKRWFASPAPTADLRAQVRAAAITPRMIDAIRSVVPDVQPIPMLTYTLYREFERNGERPGYQNPYFQRRAMLARTVVEYVMGDASMLATIQDLLWAICEETSWVLPAHEEQGPDYWRIDQTVDARQPFGAAYRVTREPDSIDLFAAETGASLAETRPPIGDDLAPEVRQRVHRKWSSTSSSLSRLPGATTGGSRSTGTAWSTAVSGWRSCGWKTTADQKRSAGDGAGRLRSLHRHRLRGGRRQHRGRRLLELQLDVLRHGGRAAARDHGRRARPAGDAAPEGHRLLPGRHGAGRASTSATRRIRFTCPPGSPESWRSGRIRRNCGRWSAATPSRTSKPTRSLSWRSCCARSVWWDGLDCDVPPQRDYFCQRSAWSSWSARRATSQSRRHRRAH